MNKKTISYLLAIISVMILSIFAFSFMQVQSFNADAKTKSFLAGKKDQFTFAQSMSLPMLMDDMQAIYMDGNEQKVLDDPMDNLGLWYMDKNTFPLAKTPDNLVWVWIPYTNYTKDYTVNGKVVTYDQIYGKNSARENGSLYNMVSPNQTINVQGRDSQENAPFGNLIKNDIVSNPFSGFWILKDPIKGKTIDGALNTVRAKNNASKGKMYHFDLQTNVEYQTAIDLLRNNKSNVDASSKAQDADIRLLTELGTEGEFTKSFVNTFSSKVSQLDDKIELEELTNAELLPTNYKYIDTTANGILEALKVPSSEYPTKNTGALIVRGRNVAAAVNPADANTTANTRLVLKPNKDVKYTPNNFEYQGVDKKNTYPSNLISGYKPGIQMDNVLAPNTGKKFLGWDKSTTARFYPNQTKFRAVFEGDSVPASLQNRMGKDQMLLVYDQYGKLVYLDKLPYNTDISKETSVLDALKPYGVELKDGDRIQGTRILVVKSKDVNESQNVKDANYVLYTRLFDIAKDTTIPVTSNLQVSLITAEVPVDKENKNLFVYDWNVPQLNGSQIAPKYYTTASITDVDLPVDSVKGRIDYSLYPGFQSSSFKNIDSLNFVKGSRIVSAKNAYALKALSNLTVNANGKSNLPVELAVQQGNQPMEDFKAGFVPTQDFTIFVKPKQEKEQPKDDEKEPSKPEEGKDEGKDETKPKPEPKPETKVYRFYKVYNIYGEKENYYSYEYTLNINEKLAQLPPDPSAKGLIFKGWSPDPTLNYDKDMNFYAQWENAQTHESIPTVVPEDPGVIIPTVKPEQENNPGTGPGHVVNPSNNSTTISNTNGTSTGVNPIPIAQLPSDRPVILTPTGDNSNNVETYPVVVPESEKVTDQKDIYPDTGLKQTFTHTIIISGVLISAYVMYLTIKKMRGLKASK